MSSIEAAVSTYILAKDGNRPWLMTRAFAEDAELEMIVKTDAISFPSAAKGLAQITEILVSRFAVDYENVYTFCLSRPTSSHGETDPPLWRFIRPCAASPERSCASRTWGTFSTFATE